MKNPLTIAIVAAWLGMMALLVHRQAKPPAAPFSDLPDAPGAADPAGDPSSAAEEWFTVSQGGHRIGWARRTVEHGAAGYTFHEDSSFALAMLGVPQKLRTSLVATTDDAYSLASFTFTLLSTAARFTASGTTDGHTLTVRYGDKGAEHEAAIPLGEPIHLPTTLRPRLVKSHPADGARFSTSVFSPLTLRNEPVTLIVEGRETIAGPAGPVEALRITEEQQGMRARAWLDDEGAALREEAALGFTLERATAESAMAEVADDAPLDLALTSRIPLAGEIPDPRGSSDLTLRVSGPAAGRIPDDPPRQRMHGDRLRITRESLPDDLPPGLPPPGSDAPAVVDSAGPSPFIESDDPAIIGTARAIVGSERDPTRAARRILDWVSDHLVQEPSLTVPSARAVLEVRRGDCNEHAVLVAALARAAGIPARVVAGAMYADGGFAYHAWTELWLGRWVSADAVFRQMPVDATHVKLIDGGPERHMALAEVIGQLAFATEGGT